jgi:hypothetical protein
MPDFVSCVASVSRDVLCTGLLCTDHIILLVTQSLLDIIEDLKHGAIAIAGETFFWYIPLHQVPHCMH